MKALIKPILVFLVSLILTPQIVLADEICYISPIKNLNTDFVVNIDSPVKDNYRGFELNIIIPSNDYLSFIELEKLENQNQEIDRNNIVNDLNTNQKITIKNIQAVENLFTLKLRTDYKMPLNEYKKAVDKDEYIVIHFELVAKEKKGKALTNSDGDTIGYEWNDTNEIVLKSYTSELSNDESDINSESNLSLMPIKAKLINIPDIR